MDGLPELLATADELYGLLPEEFTAARAECVRRLRRGGFRARALAVKELRRPSAAAWLVNALVRHRRAEVEQLLAVGEAMREAQRSLDAEQLRELDRKRQTVLTSIGRQARELARELGRPVSEQVAEEVGETLRAGLADPAAAKAVLTGRLTTALSYAGFGETDLADVVAPSVGNGSGGSPQPGRGSTATPVHAQGAAAAQGEVVPGEVVQRRRAAKEATTRQAALREATIAVRATEEAARRTEGAALVAEQHRDAVRSRAASARERLDHTHDRVAELESLLSSARQQVAAAAAGWAPLHAEAEAADHRAETARGVANSARAALEAARAHLADVEHGNPDGGEDL
jgi:hypothetical protein